MASLDLIMDYSRTQRIVLLIDLNPLLYLQNPSPYLTSLLSSIKTLLSFSPLSSSLFSFKLFFSSLSPLLSSSKLPFSSLSLSFNHPNATLQLLSQTLNSLPNSIDSLPGELVSVNSSRALHVSASMRQLLHDYAWDSLIFDPIAGNLLKRDSVCVRSNLVVLFSPVCESLKGLSDFLNVESDNECFKNVGMFSEKFREFFLNVNDAFISKDIHCSWVDVKHDLDCGEDQSGIGASRFNAGLFERGIRDLGWGFCSTDSISFGSIIVPFGLIYPSIGISPHFLISDDCCKIIHTQLSLEISDVSGNPLECKCCDLELFNLKMMPKSRREGLLLVPDSLHSQMGSSLQEKTFWARLGGSNTKLRVKAVQRQGEPAKLEGSHFGSILVREAVGVSENDEKELSSEFFADKFFEILAKQMGELMSRKPLSIWKILLSFLYREGYQALVSVSNSNNDLQMGILKPFTVSSAILYVIDGLYAQNTIHAPLTAALTQFDTLTDDKNYDPDADSNRQDALNSHCGPSSSSRRSAPDAGKRKRFKKNIHLLQGLKWTTFCKAASEFSGINLEDVYFARGCRKLKKLKFLKCWMKQIRKSSSCRLMTPDESQLLQDKPTNSHHRLIESPPESEQPIPSSTSAGDDLTSASEMQDTAPLDFCSDTLESFFSTLPSKIQQGLQSEGVELGALAERLVHSSIHWLCHKHEKETILEGQDHVIKSDDASGSLVGVELMKLLLRDPKELAAMQKSNGPLSLASDPSSNKIASENIVRQCELQILFRMEILRSDIRPSIGEAAAQRFVKQICLLLETIQCHMEGGFFGNWSLENYAGKIIKSRYCHTLQDVHRIYTKMDLLLFADDEEESNNLLNSEDSNQSWREKQEKEEMGDNYKNNEPVPVDESLQPNENGKESLHRKKRDKHIRKLIEAQERRDRARRFASFTSWVPDLQRVWAPKQLKPMKPKTDPLRKLLKRRDCKRASYDTVCETPVTEKKHSCPRESAIDESNDQDFGSQSFGSVSKALFQGNP